MIHGRKITDDDYSGEETGDPDDRDVFLQEIFKASNVTADKFSGEMREDDE